jgi:hypothetical protein
MSESCEEALEGGTEEVPASVGTKGARSTGHAENTVDKRIRLGLVDQDSGIVHPLGAGV